MKKIVIAAIIVLPLSILMSCKKDESAQLQIKVHSVIGSVQIQSSGNKRTAQTGEELKKEDLIITDNNSLIDVLYGSHGLIRILGNSNVKVVDITGKNNETNLHLKKGKLFGTLTKLKKNTLKVSTRTVVAAIRGTSFRVSADKTTSRVDVLKGKVAVQPVIEGKTIEKAEQMVEANQYVKVDEETAKASVEKDQQITVAEIPAADRQEIQKEVKDINIDSIESLNKESKVEFKQEVIQLPEEVIEKAIEKREKTTQNRTIQSKTPSADIQTAKETAKDEAAEAVQKAAEERKKSDAANIPTL